MFKNIFIHWKTTVLGAVVTITGIGAQVTQAINNTTGQTFDIPTIISMLKDHKLSTIFYVALGLLGALAKDIKSEPKK